MSFKIILKIFILCWINDIILADSPVNLTDLSTKSLANSPKIINGTQANWNGTRHQVSVRLKIQDWFFGGGHICGGSLIADDVVLTAGHCIWNYDIKALRKPSEFKVVMGNLNRFERNNTLSFNVTKISMLPTFNVTNFTDDIAIMFLGDKVPKNFTYAFPIDLNENHTIEGGTLCEVSGWGRMETNDYPSNLMVVDVPIINRTVCSQSYGDFLSDGQICAGYTEGERDACDGDSGGPLKCGDKLVGVVSWGYDCALPNFPGVYAEVAHYTSWIKKEAGLSGASTFVPMSLLGILLFTFL